MDWFDGGVLCLKWAVPLWTGAMPGKGAEQPETVLPRNENKVLRLTHISEPSLTLFPVPDAGIPTPFVMICPGGGYDILAWDLEGTEVAEWLNSMGIAAAVLKYRVPNNRAGALQDAQRAVRLVREKASEWKVDSQRIGLLGFSAGGHLAAACSNSADRPDFTILVYPAYLDKKGTAELVDEIKVDAQTPPAFLVQTQDDHAFYRSSLAYAVALDRQDIPVELHLFAKGGHGYGLRPSTRPVAQWPQLCEQWLIEKGVLPVDPQNAAGHGVFPRGLSDPSE